MSDPPPPPCEIRLTDPPAAGVYLGDDCERRVSRFEIDHADRDLPRLYDAHGASVYRYLLAVLGRREEPKTPCRRCG